MNTNYAVLVVWDCDADRVIWRGDYVFCKFIQSDCCKIGDEKYVSGKYSIDEIQQLSKVTEMWKKSTTRTAVFSNMDEEKCMWIWYFLPIWFFHMTFSREFSDCFIFDICTRIRCFGVWFDYSAFQLSMLMPLWMSECDTHCFHEGKFIFKMCDL